MQRQLACQGPPHRLEKLSSAKNILPSTATLKSWEDSGFNLCQQDYTNKMALVKADEADYTIKPENITPKIDTSAWPLLLKNWDQRTS